ncbi:MAG: hypothetical protein GY714_01835 [Desulfobacterales bacterium]|nr:hypothetical protein [Desulfobacterales bacterium]
MSEGIEIFYKDGRREYHAYKTVSFYGISSMFSCLLKDEKPNVEDGGIDDELQWLLEKVSELGIVKMEFGSYRVLSFKTRLIDDNNLNIEVIVDDAEENIVDHTKEKLQKGKKPSVSDLLQGLLSGQIKMEVLTPDDLPSSLKEMIREYNNDNCECGECNPKKRNTH